VPPTGPTLSVEVTSLDPYTDPNPYSTPLPGYKFVILDLAVTNNNAPNGFYFTPSGVRLRESSGYMYTYASNTYSLPGAFESCTIPQGETRRGRLIFQVPASFDPKTRHWVDVN
jgi:hypothetical protein